MNWRALAGIAVVLATTAGVAALLLSNRQPIAPPSLPIEVPAEGATARTSPEQVSLGTMGEQLTGEEAKLVSTFADTGTQELYTRGFWIRRHPSSLAAYLASFIVVAERSPTKPGKEPFGSKLEHPYNAGYALATLTRVWYVAGPIDSLSDRIAAQATRFAGSPDDVVRLQAAMMLVVMNARPSTHPLPPDAQDALKKLLANDFIAQSVPQQRDILEKAAQEAKGP